MKKILIPDIKFTVNTSLTVGTGVNPNTPVPILTSIIPPILIPANSLSNDTMFIINVIPNHFGAGAFFVSLDPNISPLANAQNFLYSGGPPALTRIWMRINGNVANVFTIPPSSGYGEQTPGGAQFTLVDTSVDNFLGLYSITDPFSIYDVISIEQIN